MIERRIQQELDMLLKTFPAVALLGPRQVGKTTLTRELLKNSLREVIYFDLENDDDIARMENPAFLFEQYKDACIVLDEIQRVPDLFRQLRPVIDQNRMVGRFILTGSASPALVKGVSESLAGRIAFAEMSPVNLLEAIGSGISREQHWFRGGFPTALTSTTDQQFSLWAENFIRAYIERDLSLLFGVNLSEVLIRNFWYMLAANTGSIWTAENYARALGVSSTTIKRYLDFMEGAFMVRQLPAWYINVEKRVVKAPKVYIRDSGLLHQLNRIKSSTELPLNLIVGASWEGYVIEQIYQLKPRYLEMYYYRTQHGAECDVILVDGLKPVVAIEIKYATVPSLSKGFYNVLEDLQIEKAFVITPGEKQYALDEKTTVSGLQFFLKNILSEL
ncbi:ATP-binding protein [Pedobacter heparinus]|uniref:ATP-binding protein n=1 Tax=Pedobacter heparinus TaxID=984 RepID=UPI002930DFBA|nr:ATP-binding protein [Pedobacter heparinus]